MKHSFWKRFLAMVMAIAIVLSTGVLDSASMLLASGGESETTPQETTETSPTEEQQGSSTTETLNLGTDPTETSESTDPTGTETTDPTTESTSNEVMLTVVISAVFSDESRESYVLGTEVLTYAEGEESKTLEVDIPAVEGYTFAISGAALVRNDSGKYAAALARPAESEMLYVTVTYSPAQTEGTEPSEPAEGEATEPSEPAEGEATEPSEPAVTDPTEATDPAEGETADCVCPEDDCLLDECPACAAEDYSKCIFMQEFLGNGAATEDLSPVDDTIYYTYEFEGYADWTQIVKDGDTLYLPEPPVQEGKAFAGWVDEYGNTVVAGVVSVTGTKDDTITVKPTFRDVSYIYFQDAKGAVCYTVEGTPGKEMDSGEFAKAEAIAKGSVSLEEKISGWKLNGTVVTVVSFPASGAVTLVPEIAEGYWVEFDTDGGEYMEPVFKDKGETLTLPTPVKAGYTFTGWVDSDGNQVTGSVSAACQLKATWTASSATNYTVSYWMENADDEGYTYLTSVVQQGTTGTMTNAGAMEDTSEFLDLAYCTMVDIEQKTIAADGSTIVNVYYDRNEYTVTYRRVCTTEAHSHSWRNGCYPLTCTNTSSNHTHDRNCYNRNTTPICGKTEHSHSYNCTITVTEKWGADISDTWPGGNFQVSSTGKYQASINTMPKYNETYTLVSAVPEEGEGITAYYYLQTLTGEYPENPIAYPIDSSATTTITEEDAFPFTGFEFSYYIDGGGTEHTGDSWGGRYSGAKFYYTRMSYAITMKYFDGTTIDTQSYLYEQTIPENALPSSPTPPEGQTEADGYIFKGWFWDAAGTLPVDTANPLPSTMPAKGLVVYALWERKPVEAHIYITLKDDSSPERKVMEVPYGHMLSEVVSVTEEQAAKGLMTYAQVLAALEAKHPGKTFLGWVTENGTPFLESTRITSSVTLYPVFDETGSEYTVTYSESGAEAAVVDLTKYRANSEAYIKAPANATNTSGQKFSYWQGSDGLTYVPGQAVTITGNVTLTAVYAQPPVKASITYHSNFGEDETWESGMIYLVNQKVTPGGYPADKTAKEGHSFAGWALSANGAVVGTVVIDSRNNNDLYAVWVPNRNDVIYEYTNEAPAGAGALPTGSTDVAYGTEVTVASTPAEPQGWKFSGWTTSDATVTDGKFTMPDKDVTFVGTWIKQDFKVTYSYTGTVPTGAPELPADATVTMGEDYTVEDDAVLEGYTFIGWLKDGAEVTSFEMPGNDVTLTGSWTVNQYTVTYMVDGQQVGEVETYNYNAPVTIRDKYVKEGYTVSAWSITEDFNMPAENVVIVATTSINKYEYTVKYQDEEGATLADDKTASANYGTEITAASEEISINGYTYKEGNDITIGTDASKNVITLVYTKRTDLGLKIRYVWGETEIASEVNESGLTFNQVVTREPKAVDGYTPIKTSETATIGTGENVITFYYYKNVTLTANSGEHTYDGTPKSVSGYTSSEAAATFDGITVGATGTDAGTYPATFPEGTEGTVSTDGLYIVEEATDGSLVINKRKVTMKSGSGTKEYDGAPLTNGEVTESGDGFADGEGATYNVTGTITYPGSTQNTFTYTLKEGTKAGNYDITTVNGQLTITNRTTKYVIDITANSDNVTYTGVEQSVTGFTTELTFTFDGVEYTVSGIKASGSGTDASDEAYHVVITGTPVVTDPSGTEVTDQFTVNLTNGALKINPAPLTVVTKSANKVYDGTALTAEGTITGFVNNETATFTVTGSQTDVGSTDNTYTLTWDGTAKESNYTISKTIGTLTVTETENEIVVTTTGGTFTYDGKAHGATVEVSALPAGYTLETASSNDTATNVAEGTVTANCDTLVIRNAAGEDVTSKLNITYVNGTITITPATLTIITPDANKVYDGNALTAEGSISGFVNGETATFTTTGSQTEVGSTDNTYSLDWDGTAKQSNYTISETIGTLTVTEYAGEIVVTTTGGEWTYDGQPHGATVAVTGLPTGYSVQTATSNDTATDVTPAAITADCDTLVIVNAQGVDVTAELQIKRVNGTIKINPAPLTITTESGEKVYDGKALTAGGEITGFVNNETATFATTGSQTEVGSTDNTYSLTWDGTAKESNYTIVSKTIGTLEVTPLAVTVTITGNNDTVVYNGTEQSVTGYEVTEISNDLFKESDIKFTGTAVAKGEFVDTYPMGLTKDQFSTENKNFTVTFNVIDGQLEITPQVVKVTITGNTGTEKYNGEEQEVTGYTVKCDNHLYSETSIAFSGTAVAKGTDVSTYYMGLTESQFSNTDKNFTATFVVEKDGSLEITKRDVTLTSATDSKTYDGTPLTNDKVTESGDGFVEGEGATYDVTGSQLTVGSSDNTFTYTLNSNTKAENYNITVVPGTLTVTDRETKYEITVVANSGTFTYDGTEKSVEGFKTLTFTVDGQTYTVEGLSATGVGTNAGTYGVQIFGTPVVRDKDRNDVTSQFTVKKESGTLIIDKAAVTVTITGNTDTKVYNGSEQTVTGYTITDNSDLYDVTTDVAGPAPADSKASGTNVATYYMGLAKDQFSNNDGNFTVTFNVTDGWLEITPVTDKVTVTITENSGTEKYDGSEKTVTGYTVSIDNKLYTEADFTFSGDATVNGTDAGTYNMELVPEDFTNTSINFSNVEFVIVDGTLEISKRTVTLTSASDEKVYDGNALTNSEVTVSGDGFAQDEGATYDVTGTITDVGSVDNTFTYTLDEGTNSNNYTITTELGTLTVTPVTDKVTVTITENSGSEKYDGSEKTVTGYTVSIDNELYKVTDFTFNGDATVKGTDAGTYDMELKPADFTNTSKNFSNVEFVIEDGTLKINKREVTLTSATDSKTYDGTPLTNGEVTVTGDGFAQGEGATYDVTGSQLTVGSSDNTFTYTLNSNTKADNYTINKTVGVLTVTDRGEKYQITVEANSGEYTYDGSAKTASGFKTLTFTVDGQTYTVEGLSASETQTNAGTYTVEITGTAVVKDANGNDVTAQFEVTEKDGTLKINKRTVTLTSATDSKEYDGKALTNGEVTESGEGFVAGEGATYNVTGSQTIVGNSANSFTYTLNAGTNADNYKITKVEGTLTVTDRTTKYEITVVANSGTFTYDGSEHSVSGFETLTFTVNGETYTVEGLSASKSRTDAGSDTVEITGTAVVKDVDGNDVTAQFTVNEENGTLTVEKRKVTLTSATDSKTYDGTALTNSTVTVSGEGFAQGEGATYDVTGSQLTVGSSANFFTYTLNDGTKADNYEITKVEGTLTVINRGEKFQITVKANSGSKTYDSESITVEGFETLTFTVNGQTYTVEGLTASETQTNVGTYTVEVEGTAVVKDAKGNDVTAQFIVNEEDGSLTITKRAIKITADSNSKEYDGTALTDAGYTYTDPAEGDTVASVTVSGSITEVGSVANVPSAAIIKDGDVDVTANYDITYVNGTLTITQSTKTLTVTANSNSWEYDSETHSDGGYTVTYGDESYTVAAGGSATLSTGDKVTATITAEVKDVADTAKDNNKIVTLVVENEAQYATIETVAGTLTITQKPVTITADSASKEYDGKPLTDEGYSSTDLADGDAYESVTVTGTITEVGTEKNVPSAAVIKDGEEDVTANYAITYVNGELEITQSTKTLTVTANSNSWEYDSEYHADGGYTVTYGNETYVVAAGESATLSTGDKVTATITKQVKNVADTATGNNEIGTLVVENEAQYATIETVAGTLTITQKPVTITADSNSKEYDGEPLTDEGYSSTDLADGDAYQSVTVTGTITEVGTEKNVPSAAVIKDGEEDVTANYAITYVNGELEITQSSKTLTVTANSNSWDYDGSAHSDGGYTVTYGTETYVVAAGESATLSTGDKVTATITKQVKNVADTAKDNNEIVTLVVENEEQYASIVTKSGTLEILPIDVTVTIVGNHATDVYDGTEHTVTGYEATTESKLYDVTKDFTFSGNAEAKRTEEGTTKMGLTAEQFTNTNGNFATVTFVVTDGYQTITPIDEVVVTITGHNSTLTYDGAEHTVTGYDVEISNPLYKEADFTFSGTAEASRTNVGTTNMGLAVEQFTNTNGNFAKVTFVVTDGYQTINKKTVTITADSASKEYDGQPLTDEGYTSTLLADGDAYESVTVTGTITEVGSEANVPSAAIIKDGDVDVTANYDITYVNGTLTITQSTKTLTVTANSNSWEYDSEYHADGGYTVTYGDETYVVAAGESATLSTGDTVTATITKQVKNVADTATGNNEIVTLVVENEAQYATIKAVAGTLTITQKPVTITADSDSKEYDGKPLTDEGYTSTDLADGDAYESVTVTGTITEVGTEKNVPSAAVIKDGEEDVTANYAITYVNGELKITQSSKTLTVTANSNSWEYDSEYHADGGYTVTYGDETYVVAAGESATLSTGDKVTATITKQVKNVSDTAEGNNEIVTLVVENEAQYATIKTVAGTLEITEKEVTITADSDSKEYDGKPLTDDGYSSTDLADGDAYQSVTVTGTITEVGSTSNVASDAIIMDGTENVTANYDITYVDGTLEITQSSKTLTVTANSDSWIYDSEYHADGGYTVTYGDETYVVAAGESATLSTGDTVTATITARVKNVADTAEGNNKIVTLVVENEEQYASIVTEDGTLEITEKEVTITADSSSKEYDGKPLTDDGYTSTLLATGDAYESVTVTGTITEVGTTSNVASNAIIMDGDEDVTANYDITYVDGTLEITASSKTLTVTANSNSWEYDSEYHADGGYTVTYGDESYTVAAGESVTLSTGDTVTATITKQVKNVADTVKGNNEIVTLVVENEEQYASIKTVPGTLTITQKAITITADSDSKEYDGKPLTDDGYTYTAPATGDTVASVTVTGSITTVGTVFNVPSAAVITDGEEDVTANYAITYVKGQLQITKTTKVLTVTANSNTWTYDGETHTDGGYTVTYGDETYVVAAGESATLSTGDTVTATITKQVKNAADTAEGNNAIVALVVENASQYANVTSVPGTLTINRREVTITSGDASKEYDSLPLTKEEATVTSGSFAEGEGVKTYHSFASQTLVGVTENTFDYTLKSNTLADNYVITLVPGTLEVTNRTQPYVVVVEANSGDRVYNGQPFTVSGLKSATVARMAARINEQSVTFILNGNTFTITGLYASRTETDVNPATPVAVDVLPYTGYEVPVEGVAVITDEQGNDVTAQFTVETISGVLTIHPAPVTLTSADDTKLYDGTELVNHNVTAEGFVEGEGASYDVTGSQTLIGSSDNTFTYTLNEGTKAQNYAVETVFGTLTVTPPDDYEIVEKTHETDELYRLGDTVTFDITVENIFSEEATVVITEQEGVSILWNGQKVQSVTTTIGAGETLTLQAEYVIQEKDILAGDFTNVVDVKISATVDEIPYEGEDDDDDIVDEIEDPKAHLTLDKVTISTPAAENGKYVVGEKIVYEITATNTGNLTLHDIVIYDVLSGIARSGGASETFTVPGTLAPGESYTITYEYTVVEEDLGKTLTNAVTAEAGNSSDEDDDEDNDTPTEVDPDEVQDETDDIRRDLQVEKTVLNKKDVYKLHTYVEYQIVVTNNGNITERGAILTDIMDAQGLAKQFTFTDLDGGQLLPGNRVLLADIAPGASVTILCKYWVDGKDEALPVNNKATVESPDGETGDEDDAETVMVEQLYNLTIYYLSDDWQVVMAPEYHGRYSVGHTYYVESPEIEGYEANYKVIWSGWDGMPEHDVVCYVLYSKLPEETTEPTEETTEPTEETTEPTTEPTEPTYDLTEIPEDEVPLGDLDLGNHTCCIMHFLIMLVAMILLGCYTKDRKKYQERIHELKRALAAEDAAAALSGEEEQV